MENFPTINLLVIIFLTIHEVNSMLNGCQAKPGQFKYVVSIRWGALHLCSGAIIDEKHIITVAHTVACIPSNQLRVAAGLVRVYNPYFTPFIIQNIYVHPDYKMKHFLEPQTDYFFENDIAVLKLQGILIWSPTLAPVSLMRSEPDWNACSLCGIISWRFPVKNMKRRMDLVSDQITVLSDEVGQRLGCDLLNNEKCFNNILEGNEIGSEDLGSPIVYGNFMAGLVVRDQRGLPEKFSTLLSIVPYWGFIADIVTDGFLDINSEVFPYIVSVWYRHAYACGGFIIDPTHIVTVGHCVVGLEKAEFEVSVGYIQVSLLNPIIEWISVENVLLHPKYKIIDDIPLPNWSIEHDLAILTLKHPISSSPSIGPLQLPTADDFLAGEVCQVLRWKREYNGLLSLESITLKTSYVKLLDDANSRRLDPYSRSRDQLLWGKTLYAAPIADPKDVGNPIICRGSPIGFLVQAISVDGEWPAKVGKFVKVRSYEEFIISSPRTM